MVVSALVLFVARHAIASVYTDDPAVLELAASLLVLAGLFQISDGLQLGCARCAARLPGRARPARGHREFRTGASALRWRGVFGIVRHGGAPGVWLGLIAGLTAAGVLLALRFRVISARPGRSPRRRVSVSETPREVEHQHLSIGAVRQREAAVSVNASASPASSTSPFTLMRPRATCT